MWQKPIKKTVFTLNINNYSPIIRSLTKPFLMHWIKKIGANYHEINTRKFPDLDIEMEKLQIYELAQKQENDWNIYIDADALIHPEFYDPTNFMSKDTVAHNGADMANLRWTYDRYFLRDGRNIGSCNWLAIASDWCIDLWKPLDDITYKEALKNIHPIPLELHTVVTAEHLITDYILSRNIAKYGLKFTTLIDMNERLNMPHSDFFYHEFLIDENEKISRLCDTIANWYLHALGKSEDECRSLMVEFKGLDLRDKVKEARKTIKTWKL